MKSERDSGQKIGDLKGRDDLLLPRLEDYINICKKYEKKAILEVKNRMQLDIFEKLVEELKELDYLDERLVAWGVDYITTNILE